MTIHSEHPFLDPERDPVRQLRGRLGGAVTLWTSGGAEDDSGWAGLTVTSMMVAAGEPARVLALIDPDSDLGARLGATGSAAVSLLTWEDRQVADAFAGVMPAPGGAFRMAPFEPTEEEIEKLEHCVHFVRGWAVDPGTRWTEDLGREIVLVSKDGRAKGKLDMLLKDRNGVVHRQYKVTSRDQEAKAKAQELSMHEGLYGALVREHQQHRADDGLPAG